MGVPVHARVPALAAVKETVIMDVFRLAGVIAEQDVAEGVRVIATLHVLRLPDDVVLS